MQKLSAITVADDDCATTYLNELLLVSLGITDQLFGAENGAEALQFSCACCSP